MHECAFVRIERGSRDQSEDSTEFVSSEAVEGFDERESSRVVPDAEPDVEGGLLLDVGEDEVEE